LTRGKEAPTQMLGHAVYSPKRIEAILYPSTKDRPDGRCLALLPGRLGKGSSLEIADETGLVHERFALGIDRPHPQLKLKHSLAASVLNR